MALRPHLWAMDDAPVLETGGNSTWALILIALADEAADDGTGACPYIPKLKQRGRCSERTVQNTLRALFQARLINNGDPRVAMRRYNKSAGQAPRCWDLNLEATVENLPTPRTDDEMKREYSAMIGIRVSPEKPSTKAATSEVHNLHPSPEQGKLPEVHNLHPSGEVQPVAPHRCSQLHPTGAASCTLPACDLSVPENPPTPQPEEQDPAGTDHRAEKRGGDDQTPNLNEVVDAAVAVRADAPGWSVNAVRRAVREARTDGWSDALIVEALAHIASDVPRAGWAGTQYPARLRHWLAAEARKQAAPENGETLPLSYAMPADRPRCQTHPGYPGDNCTACLKDAEIAEAEMAREAAAAAASVVPREQAGAAARAAARALIAQRHGRAAALAGKPFAGAGHVTAERSTQLAQLAEMSNA